MSTHADTAEQWFAQNSGRLIDCRWGCRITPEACRLYQTRARRHVIYFGGSEAPALGVNGDFVLCVRPEPCPHLLPEETGQETSPATWTLHNERLKARRSASAGSRKWEELTNPDIMLDEPAWRRSLVRR
ncbi:MAG: hypothetical protein AB1646_11905 [Thermodesulfobacteriota bacterium]